MRARNLLALLASIALVAACGSSSKGGTGTNAATTTKATTTTTTTTATTAPATTTTVPVPAQLAIWPAADVVFTTPEAAANDFLAKAFTPGPVIGPFVGNDQRSGEFQVFATADNVKIGSAKSTLLMRQLGPSNGWFVLAAASDVATVVSPASLSTVAAGPVTVKGVGTGFEATVVVRAFVAGTGVELDRKSTMAGNLGQTLPYSVTLDVSKASKGDVVVLLVQGGVGLETDPGDFGAVPVLIG